MTCIILVCYFGIFCFFKQKTAYEMRISDWSSDVCSSDLFKPTARTKVKRLNERAHYDRESTYAVLDAGLVAHVGYVFDGSPYVTSTSYWREGDRLFWHGSSASRLLKTVRGGIPVCVNVRLIDGLVMARSGFHPSDRKSDREGKGVSDRVNPGGG